MTSATLQKFLDEIRTLPEFICQRPAPVGVSTRGLFGNTPLHVAAIRGDVDIITSLLAAGATIDARGEQGDTPLHDATSQGHAKAVELLLVSGADPSIENEMGHTAEFLAKLGGQREIALLFQTQL
jgi:ankyrin repeat protein